MTGTTISFNLFSVFAFDVMHRRFNPLRLEVTTLLKTMTCFTFLRIREYKVKSPNVENNNSETIVLHRNKYIQPPHHLAALVSKLVPIRMDGIKEPSINSTRMLNIIMTDLSGVMNLIIDA